MRLLDVLLDLGAVAWLRFLRYRWSRLRRALLERRYRDAPLPSVRSLEDVSAVLAQVRWTPDGPLHLYDAISWPGTTWASRRDDCDGFAALAAELLRRLDASYAPLLVTVVVRPFRRSHTVCAFRDPATGELRIFDNARLPADTFFSTSDVAGYLGRRGRRTVCWDVVEPRSLRVLVFHNERRRTAAGEAQG